MANRPMLFPTWLLVKYDLTTDEFKGLTEEKKEELVQEHQALIDAWEYENKKAVQSAN